MPSRKENHEWYMSWLDEMGEVHKDNPRILKKLNDLRTIEVTRYEANNNEAPNTIQEHE